MSVDSAFLKISNYVQQHILKHILDKLRQTNVFSQINCTKENRKLS